MSPEICFTFHTRIAATPLPAFIRRIVADFPITYHLREEPSRIILQASGPEAELAALAEVLGRELPLSIFLTASEITAVDALPEAIAAGSLTMERPANFVPTPCPRCLVTAEENFQAGRAVLDADCDLCGIKPATSAPLAAVFPAGERQISADPATRADLFRQAAEHLAADLPLSLYTPQNGWLIATAKPQKRISQVMITDPTLLPAYWQCGDDELLLLAALEKPLVRLEPTSRCLEEYNLPARPLPVGLADELFYWYLGRHLQTAGLPLLFLAAASEPPINAAALLSQEGTPPLSARRPLMVTVDRQRWLLSGGRALPAVPAPTKTPAQTPSDRHLGRYRGFLAATAAGTEPAGEKTKLFGISLLPGPQGLALLEGNSPETARVFLLSAATTLRPAEEILAAVAALDEAASRLCDNYAARFPQRWQALQNTQQRWQLDDPEQLWALVATLAGVTGELFLELAATMTLGRSPRLELSGKKENEVGDLHRLLRSTMSYTLAGASPAAICRGCLESLAERLAAMIWSRSGPESQPRVALCSELALHPAFLGAILRQGGPSFLLPPPPLALDALLAQEPAGWHDSPKSTPDGERRAALRSLFGLLD